MPKLFLQTLNSIICSLAPQQEKETREGYYFLSEERILFLVNIFLLREGQCGTKFR
jgi:hypothetical protein